MANQPVKLNPDSVVEAILDLRFRYSGSPELIPSKLASIDFISDMEVERLPLADMPAQVRREDPDLIYQPIFQLRNPNVSRAAKVGERSFSLHVLAPYPGWLDVAAFFRDGVEHLFRQIKQPIIERIGLRYINVLRRDAHGVDGFGSTNMHVSISSEDISSQLNLNYKQNFAGADLLVRMATPEFVSAPTPDFSLIIDLDAFSQEKFNADTPERVMDWAENAHTYVKREFLRLLQPKVLGRLTGGVDADFDVRAEH